MNSFSLCKQVIYIFDQDCRATIVVYFSLQLSQSDTGLGLLNPVKPDDAPPQTELLVQPPSEGPLSNTQQGKLHPTPTLVP